MLENLFEIPMWIGVHYSNITWAFKLLVYYVYEILQQVNMKIIIND